MKCVPVHNLAREVVATVLVDDEDFERVSARNWALHPDGYAQGRAHAGAPRPIMMHRFILGLAAGPRGHQQLVDHINGDRLDNRRENLRIVGASANGQNRRTGQGKTSGHRGVSYCRRSKRWRATAKLNQRWIGIGRFKTEEEAAQAAADFRAAHMPYSQEAALTREEAG